MGLIRLRYLLIICFHAIAIANLFGIEDFQAQENNNEKTEYLSCKIWSQFGNQFLSIATTLGLAWDNGAVAVFPELVEKDGMKISENYKKVFFRLNVNRPIILKKYFPIMTNDSDLVYKANGCIYPWIPIPKIFDKYRDRIVELFRPSEEMEQRLLSEAKDIIDHPNSVAIHIRINRVAYQKSFPFPGKDYFFDAMDLFPDDALFVVFSCHPGWAKKHFEGYKKNMIFIEGNDHIFEWYLMYKCKNMIISRSSYSWTAAFMNDNLQSGKIVRPENLIPYFLSNPKHWKGIVCLDREANEIYYDVDDFESSSISGG